MDFASGHVPPERPPSSGLSGLVKAAGTQMSLPQAMAALERGEIERPVDGALGGLLAPAALPARPAQPERKSIWDEITTEARMQAAVDQDEMRAVIERKRASSGDMSVAQRQRLDEVEQQLNGETENA